MNLAQVNQTIEILEQELEDINMEMRHRYKDDPKYVQLLQNIKLTKEKMKVEADKVREKNPKKELSDEEVVAKMPLLKRRKFAKNAAKLEALSKQVEPLYNSLKDHYESVYSMRIQEIEDELSKLKDLKNELNANNPDELLKLANRFMNDILSAEAKPSLYEEFSEKWVRFAGSVQHIDSNDFKIQIIEMLKKQISSNQYQLESDQFDLEDFRILKSSPQVDKLIEAKSKKVAARQKFDEIFSELVKTLESSLKDEDVSDVELIKPVSDFSEEILAQSENGESSEQGRSQSEARDLVEDLIEKRAEPIVVASLQSRMPKKAPSPRIAALMEKFEPTAVRP